MNRLKQLTTHGQSIWLDYIKRSFVADGELRKLIAEDGLTGVTSNPAIFEEAIARGNDYDAAIRRAADRQESAEEAYERIVFADMQLAADDLRSVYERTGGHDGYVSLEVSPHLAHETAATVEQGREFWQRVDRPNLFIKVPGTEAGLGAVRQLIAEGINVNVTLLFGLPRYRAVAEAYFSGLEDRVSAGQSVDRIWSVASFFLSRIDLAVDQRLEELAKQQPEVADRARALRSHVAIASARQAYQMFKGMHAAERFRRLAAVGAHPQRLLWASTSTKNPEERDVRYVEALIGPETINTMPRPTLEAFRDHGEPQARIEEDADGARRILRELGELGISLDAVSQQLEREGLEKFAKPFDHLHAELERKLVEFAPASRKR